jgi:hypothetical protein
MVTDIGSARRKQMNTNIERLSQIDATVAPGLDVSVCAGTEFTRSTPRDLVLPWRPNLARACRCRRDARREERNGFPYTAAMKWRDAAKLFAPDTRAVEYCWSEWERIMQLPRRLAGQACVVPTIARVI